MPVVVSETREMSETQSSVKEVIPEIGGNFSLDESVIAGQTT